MNQRSNQAINVYHKQKTLSLILGVLMLSVTLLSVIYIAREADHNCVDSNCPICESIQQCEHNLKQVGSGVIGQCVQIVIAAFFVRVLITIVQPILCNSLVAQKIRLNN